MCKILLSINPEYVECILSGEKKYEYRKQRCRRKIDRIVIYSTCPVKKVVAEVSVSEIVDSSPVDVWERTKDFSGITKEFYDSYYKGRERAIAYKLGTIKRYNPPLPLEEFGLSSAPQSFVYLPDEAAN